MPKNLNLKTVDPDEPIGIAGERNYRFSIDNPIEITAIDLRDNLPATTAIAARYCSVEVR